MKSVIVPAALLALVFAGDLEALAVKNHRKLLGRLSEQNLDDRSSKVDKLTPKELTTVFNLVQKNILSENQLVQGAALELFFRLDDSLNQQQIALIVTELFNNVVLQGLLNDGPVWQVVEQKQRKARILFYRLVSYLSEQQKNQVVAELMKKLENESTQEKINYDAVADSFSFLFDLVKKDIFKEKLESLFTLFKKLLFLELKQNKDNKELLNPKAKLTFKENKYFRILSLLANLLETKQEESIKLDLENKTIFQSLFDIAQAVAEESDPEVKARGLWILKQMVK